MGVDDLLSRISSRGGLAMANRYQVIIPGMDSDGGLLCQSVSLPGITINTKDYQTVRNAFKVPQGVAFSDVNMSFLVTSDFYARKFFDKWRKQVIDPETFRVEYESYYASQIRIFPLDRQNKIIYKLILNKAYPISLTDTQLANDQTDYIRQEVTFAYRDYTIID
jgi:hypothetical protein